jgi:DNA-binding transcriptional LysR family regulator
VLLCHPGGRRPPELTDTGRVVFRALRPGVEVAIRAATDVGQLHRAVEAGELDVCFTVLPVKDDGPFELHDLMTDRCGRPDLPPRQLVAMRHRDRHLGATRAFLDAATEICGGWAT